MKCSYDPQTLLGDPIGMFHCPECGEMVVAGLPHPDDEMTDEAALALHLKANNIKPDLN